jgi:hypothetical protein
VSNLLSEDEGTSCSHVSYHHSWSLHQVGDILHYIKPSFSKGPCYVIVVIDYFTKWVEAIPTFKDDGDIVALFLFNQIIARFSVMREIVTDHSSHF